MRGNWRLENWRLGWERTLFHSALFCMVCLFFIILYYSLPFSFLFLRPLMFLRYSLGLRTFRQYGPISSFGLATPEAKSVLSPIFRVIVEHLPFKENTEVSADAWLTFLDSFLFWFLQRPQSLQYAPFLGMKNCRWPENFGDTEKENSTESWSVPSWKSKQTDLS